MKANSEQGTLGHVMVASVSSKMCGQCSAQGFDNFIGYNPTYWQYMDKMVNWGGADDEGIIVPPPAGTIDAAHAQGVKVYANMFFQATTNGKPWAKQILTEENGVYPYARKLVEMALYYGFDGYFINDESNQGLHSYWTSWIKDFYKACDEVGDNNLEIIWYDASDKPDIEKLNTHPRTSHFIDYQYWYNYDMNFHNLASQINTTFENTFNKVYNGVECAMEGYQGFGAHLDRNFPRNGEHIGSMALFCPEEPHWKNFVNGLFFTENARGEEAYKAMKSTFERERATWVNNSGDPSTTSTTWRGISGCVVEASTIDGFPFITSFNVGNGKHRFAQGKKLCTRDWSFAGMQSYMPTWRYWIEGGDKLVESIDWDDAYSGGNSIKISGTLSAGSHLMRLFKTMAACDGGELKLTYKSTNTVVPVLRLSTTSSTNTDIEISAKGTSTSNGWTIANYDLSSVKGKTIYLVGFDLKADIELANYEMKLGQLTITPAGYSPKPVEISALNLENKLGNKGGDMRLTWDWADNSDLDHFDIYVVSPSGNRTLAGQTRGEAFYIPEIVRDGNDVNVTIEVVSVMKDGKEGVKKSAVAEFEPETAPVVTITTSSSYAKKGDVITLTATGTFNPTSCRWEIPEGLTLENGSSITDFSVRVKVDALGSFKAKAFLTNNIGEGSAERFVVDGLSDDAYAGVSNVALLKKIVGESAPFQSNQSAEMLVDGDKTPVNSDEKWHSVSKKPFAEIDLQDNYKIYGFGLFDCKSGNDNSANLPNYKIEVSRDGTDWTEVVDHRNSSDENVKYDYIEPVVARYVRLAPYHTNTITTRVWEFEVYGCDVTSMTIDCPAEIVVNVNDTKTFKVGYNLNGEARADNFGLTVEGSDNSVRVESVVEDKAQSAFDVTIAGGDVYRISSLSVLLTNGEFSRQRDVKVYVEDPAEESLAKGVKATVYHFNKGMDPNAPMTFYYGSQAYTKLELNNLTDGDVTTDVLTSLEKPSTYTYDLYVDFSLKESAKIGRVKISFPYNNYAENENGTMLEIVDAFIIQDARRASSNKYTDLGSAKNIGRRDYYQYVFDEPVDVKDFRIRFNIKALAYPALAEIEVYPYKETTGIEEIESGFGIAVSAIYDLYGRKVENPVAGIYVVVYADGSTKKIYVK